MHGHVGALKSPILGPSMAKVYLQSPLGRAVVVWVIRIPAQFKTTKPVPPLVKEHLTTLFDSFWPVIGSKPLNTVPTPYLPCKRDDPGGQAVTLYVIGTFAYLGW